MTEFGILCTVRPLSAPHILLTLGCLVLSSRLTSAPVTQPHLRVPRDVRVVPHDVSRDVRCPHDVPRDVRAVRAAAARD